MLRVAVKALFLAGLAAGAFGWGFLTHRLAVFPYEPLTRLYYRAADAAPPWLRGRQDPGWSLARDASVPSDTRERLLSLPYLQGYRPPAGAPGVRGWDPSAAFNGLNLVVSGHGPEASLVDMAGRERWTWRLPFDKAWPGAIPSPENTGHDRFWREAIVAPNGDLLAIFEGEGLVRLDRDSRLLWAAACGCHHSVTVAPDGSIWTLGRKRTARDWGRGRVQLLDDAVLHLAPDGRVVTSFSIVEALRRSDFASVLTDAPRFGDVLHANHLQLLGEPPRSDFPYDRPGFALVSLATISAVAVVDLSAERVVWLQTGPWYHQHTPTLLPGGTLLVFDNGGNFTAGRSRAVEIDLRTQQVAWRFGDGPAEAFESASNGMVQRLPNGNTLIVESNGGRALEVTTAGRAVWEFRNPNRTSEGRLVATLFAVHRYDESVCTLIRCPARTDTPQAAR